MKFKYVRNKPYALSLLYIISMKILELTISEKNILPDL